MSLRLKICRDDCGTWCVHGLSPAPVSDLPTLAASLDYARNACNAAPATIELSVDGMYVVVHQECGWPRRLLSSETDRPRPAMAGQDLTGASMWTRFLAWLRTLRRLSAEHSAAAPS
jgi:hypothetical protein